MNRDRLDPCEYPYTDPDSLEQWEASRRARRYFRQWGMGQLVADQPGSGPSGQ